MQAGLVIIVVIGIAYALALLTGHLIWTLFYFLIFLVSLHRYFFPTHYRLTPDYLEVGRPWRNYRLDISQFRSFTETKTGIQLNRMGHDSFIDRLRGVYILTGKKHDAVVGQLKASLEQA